MLYIGFIPDPCAQSALVVPQKVKNDNGEKSEMSLGQRRGHMGVGLEWYG